MTSATEGAYWQNTYDPDAEWGPAFHDVRHNFIFSATYELPFGHGRTVGSDMVAAVNAIARRLARRRHLPGAQRVCRSPSSTAARDRCRANAAPSVRTASAIRMPSDQSIDRWLDINAFEAAPLGTFGNCPVGVARAPGYTNLDLMFSKRVDIEGPRYARVPHREPSTRSTTRASARRRVTSRTPNTFGTITNTISSPRVIELVLKFYF